MTQKPLRRLAVLSFAAALLALAPTAPAHDGPHGKIIVIGSDGADYKLVRKYIDEGQLPNLARLEKAGTFRPLATSNPAQSPVSWATFNTGSNPGKTNIFDFLKRELPNPGLITFAMADAELVGTFEVDAVRSLVTKAAVGLAAACAVVFLVLAFVFKRSYFLSAVVALVIAGGATAAGWVLSSKVLPLQVTRPKNNIGGTTWVKVASEAGVPVKALQMACCFPPEKTPGAQVLAGLGVPDLVPGFGTWFYYSSDGEAGDTQMGGRGFSIDYKPDVSEYAFVVPGPENPVLRDQIRELKKKSRATTDVSVQSELELKVKTLLDEEVTPLWTAIESSSFTYSTAQSLKTDTSRSDRAIRDAKAIGAERPSMPKRLFPFTVKVDRAKGGATFTFGGRSETLTVGKWSDLFEPEFRFNALMAVTGTCRVFLLEASAEKLRFLVSPVNFHPGKLPLTIDISYPREYASELASDHGCFETLGWACMTNPLKDGKITEQGFLDNVEMIEKPRRDMILSELAAGGWQVFFGMLSGTDRVQHMMFRHIDPEHPLHDPELAKEFGGSVLDAYKKLDALVGEIDEKYCRDGETTLMIVSDHGFGSYRRGVNLNSWLVANGFQAGKDASGRTLSLIKAGDIFEDTDWSQTKAYSYSLGKICLNLVGREKDGIVKESEADAVMDEIITKLKALTDEKYPGRQVVKDVYKAKDIYKGPNWKNSEDLIVGFAEGYRIDWDSCLGGRTAEVFVDNDSTWSGDHCSIDPSLVPGIFFCNKKLAGDDPRVIDLAPTILSLLGIDRPADWDGKPLGIGN